MNDCSRVALVISGGGAKGAFAVGAIQSLYTRFRHTGWFSIVGGSSVGALIAPFAALMAAPEPTCSRAMENLVRLGTGVRTSDVLARQGVIDLLYRHDCLNESDPLEATIRRELDTSWFEWLQRPEAPDCYVVYTNFRTGNKVFASPKDAGMSFERFVTCMLASASVPVLMEAALIDGDVCYDGGVRDILPFEKAIDLGAESIVPIMLDPLTMGVAKKRFARMDEVLLRAAAILMDETALNDFQLANHLAVANHAMRELLAAFKDDPIAMVRIRAVLGKEEYRELFDARRRLTRIAQGIRPEKVITEDPLNFEPAKLSEWMEWGRRKADMAIRESPFATGEEEGNNTCVFAEEGRIAS